MNDNERKELAKQLIVLAEIYGRDLSRQALGFMLDQLNELNFEEAMNSLNKYCRDSKNRTFPTPGQLLAIAKPEASDIDNAAEVANRIIQAMSKYGWTQPEKAKQFIGEVGWLVVQREGGWGWICETTTEDKIPTLKAQWRVLASSLVNRSRSGQLDVAPSLPKPQNVTELKQIESK